jgi:hypothetical protein
MIFWALAETPPNVQTAKQSTIGVTVLSNLNPFHSFMVISSYPRAVSTETTGQGADSYLTGFIAGLAPSYCREPLVLLRTNLTQHACGVNETSMEWGWNLDGIGMKRGWWPAADILS